MEYLLYYLVLNLYGSAITWRFFQAAGIPVWKAFVPVYRTYLWTKIADRPWWWTILAYIPVVDNAMALVLAYETLHMFGFRQNKHIFLTAATGGLYLGYLNYSAKLERGVRSNDEIRSRMPLWVNHILWAVVAAGTVRMMTFEAFNIPTPSMEKSLMVGDYLVVSKIAYGLRMPNTPMSIPLMHNVIPFANVPSYLTLVQLPYLRLPGLAKVQRGDAVVFNFPQDPGRPADKKDHYVKRCMGTPGDTLELRHTQVFIDGEAVAFPERSNAQFSHYVRTRPGQGFSPRQLKKDFDINYVTNMTVNNQNVSDVLQITETEYVVTIPSQSLAKFAQMPSIDTMFAMDALAGDSTFAPGTPEALKWYYSNFVAGGMIFPNPMGGHSDSLVYPWTRDNFGPLWIPAKGSTIALNYDTYLKYEHAVNAYEGHELTRELGPEGERFYVDGQPATSYTFALDYYWMMGDNRHNSWDSRYWGFVPETHVVGKPVFIFWSMDSFKSGIDKIRSERLFTVVHGDGKPRSYLIPFLALVGAYYAWEWFRKRKKS